MRRQAALVESAQTLADAMTSDELLSLARKVRKDFTGGGSFTEPVLQLCDALEALVNETKGPPPERQQIRDLIAENSEHLRTIEKLLARLAELGALVEVVDRKSRKAVDANDWITSYTLPVGPWHRLLAKAREEMTPSALTAELTLEALSSLLVNPNADAPHTPACSDGSAVACLCQEDSRDPDDVLRQAREIVGG